MRIRRRPTFLWLLACLLILHAPAGGAFSVTSPSANTRIEQGASFLVSWNDLAGNASSLTITIGQGPSAEALLIKATLATVSSPGVSGSATVSIPSTITAADNYFLRLSANTIPASAAIQGPLGVFVPGSTTPSNSSSAAPLPSASSVQPSSSSAAPSSIRPSSSASSSAASPSASASSSSSSSASSSSGSRSSSTAGPTHIDGTEQESSSSLSAGGIAGIAIGGVAAAALVFAGAICLRKTGNSNGKNHADTTAAEIFANQSGHKKPRPSQSSAPAPLTRSPQLPNMMQPMPPPSSITPQGQFYSTGYDDGYYYGGAAAAAYEQQQHYSGYGYHPAAVYMPNLAHHQPSYYDGGYQQQTYYEPMPSPVTATGQYSDLQQSPSQRPGPYYTSSLPQHQHPAAAVPMSEPPAAAQHHRHASSVPHTPGSPAAVSSDLSPNVSTGVGSGPTPTGI